MVDRYMIDPTGRPWRHPNGLYVWHSDYDKLAADFLALKEHCAALESREVCTVAHDGVETCGYCQRDGLERLLKRGVVFALNCEFDPNQPLGFRQKAAAWLDAVSVAIGMGRPDDSCDHTWVDTGRCNKCGLGYEKWIGDDAFCEEGCSIMGAHEVCEAPQGESGVSRERCKHIVDSENRCVNCGLLVITEGRCP